MSKQIPELDIIATPTAGQESLIETVVARHDTYATSRMTLAQIFTLGSISGSIKVALDALWTLIAANTASIALKLNTIGWTRTGLTANRAIYTNGSWVESFLTWWTTEFIWFDGSWMPIAKVPDGRIAWELRMWSTATPPTNWLICNGSAISRTTYATLYWVIWTTFWVGDGSTTFNIPDLSWRTAVGSQAAVSKWAATITIASPWVITNTGHLLANGNKVYFTTTWALPTGLTVNTKYFIVNATANTFQVAATIWGTAINTSWSQSGTHTLFSANFDSVGSSGWEVNHTLGIDEIPSHSHSITVYNIGWATLGIAPTNQNSAGVYTTVNTNNQWSGLSHNIVQPYVTVNYIIAT